MSLQTKHIYEFGPFRLVEAEHLLLCDGKAVPLTPKAFDLLLTLVEGHGHLLEKEELLKMVWPDTFIERFFNQRAPRFHKRCPCYNSMFDVQRNHKL